MEVFKSIDYLFACKSIHLVNVFVGDDRMHHICRWPAHREHFDEAEDTFYKRYSYIVVMKRLVTIIQLYLKFNISLFILYTYRYLYDITDSTG